MKKRKRENLLQEIVQPVIPKFKLKDILQVIIGATILAIPVGFTEETWRLGETLPTLNVSIIVLISLAFISMFTYYHYHNHSRGYWGEFTKRVLSTYVLSFLVVATLLTLIQKAPWSVEPLVAFNRAVLVTLPSSMSAVIADTL